MKTDAYILDQQKAHGIVSRTVKSGKLPDLKATEVFCVDCGERATQYDHRDYGEPLKVEPVCRSCNAKRGKALAMAAKNHLQVATVSIKVTRNRYKELRRLAKANGHTISWLANFALDLYFQSVEGQEALQNAATKPTEQVPA